MSVIEELEKLGIVGTSTSAANPTDAEEPVEEEAEEPADPEQEAADEESEIEEESQEISPREVLEDLKHRVNTARLALAGLMDSLEQAEALLTEAEED